MNKLILRFTNSNRLIMSLRSLGLLMLCIAIMPNTGTSQRDSKGGNEQRELVKTETVRAEIGMDWREGSYLVFGSEKEFAATYDELEKLLTRGGENSDLEDSCFEFPVLDQWEKSQRGFKSMRSAYEAVECDLLDKGFAPEQIKEMPVIDDVLATLLSPDGLVQVEGKICYFGEDAFAKAPVREISTLKGILNGRNPISPNLLGDRGIEIELRGGGAGNCNADFNFQINHNTLDVTVEYTGSPIVGGDKSITWSAIAGNNHLNQTNFTLDYTTPGSKTICVTYNEYDVVPDTTYYYVMSVMTVNNGDTIYQDTTYEKKFYVQDLRKLVCSDTECKTIELGGCTAEFSHTVGIDNVVSFANLSSVPHGTITSVLWQFGDGNTSTAMHPTHTYECDKTFEVTLIIYSSQCPGGSATFSQSVDATGIRCCDFNPQSSWKWKHHPTDNEKKIKYRYDMGTNGWIFNGLLDQDLKGKIKYYEYRKGGIFGSKKWRKTKGTLDVNFEGPVFGNDEDGCTCQDPRDTEASPVTHYGKTKTFKDEFGGWWTIGNDKKLRIKDTDPVVIKYLVNGTLYVTQVTANTPGFHCE